MKYLSATLSYIKAHKFLSAVVFLIVIVVVYFKFSGKSSAQTQYVIGSVEKGTITATLSESGQILSSNQVDIKPKASGDVTYVTSVVNQEVKAGTLIAQLDATDAQKAVRDAQLAYTNAQTTLKKFQLDQGTTQDQRTDSLSKDYTDGANGIASAYLDLTNIMQGTSDVLYADTLHGDCSPNLCQYPNYIIDSDSQRSFNKLLNQAVSDYTAAKSAYDPALSDYRSLRLLEADNQTINDNLATALSVLKLSAQAIKSEQNMLDALADDINHQAATHVGLGTVPTQVATYQSSLTSLANTTNSRITSVLSIQDSIQNDQQTIASAQIGDPLDLSNEQNTVDQKLAALEDAQSALTDLSIRAPFDGVLASVAIKKGDSVSTGTTIGTIFAKQSMTEVSLNETDISKVQVGQKATLTFDALPDLTLTGTVTSVDTLGTTSQGVVSYKADISLDTENDQVKPGMSVTADIITGISTDTLMVPTSALKQQNGQYYVQTVSGVDLGSSDTTTITASTLPGAITQKPVMIGLQSDTTTEIKSGLSEGDEIVTRTVTASTTSSTASTTTRTTGGASAGSTIRIPGSFGGGSTFGR